MAYNSDKVRAYLAFQSIQFAVLFTKLYMKFFIIYLCLIFYVIIINAIDITNVWPVQPFIACINLL